MFNVYKYEWFIYKIESNYFFINIYLVNIK